MQIMDGVIWNNVSPTTEFFLVGSQTCFVAASDN